MGGLGGGGGIELWEEPTGKARTEWDWEKRGSETGGVWGSLVNCYSGCCGFICGSFLLVSWVEHLHFWRTLTVIARFMTTRRLGHGMMITTYDLRL